MNRDFKGVWIPKKIWLSKDLTLQEKVFIVEIDSLDNENGCFATNKYLSEFFDISIRRVSTVITTLHDKGFISIEFEKGNRRIIRIIKESNRTKVHEGMEQKFHRYRTKVHEGMEQKFLHNNTFNNTSINTRKEEPKKKDNNKFPFPPPSIYKFSKTQISLISKFIKHKKKINKPFTDSSLLKFYEEIKLISCEILAKSLNEAIKKGSGKAFFDRVKEKPLNEPKYKNIANQEQIKRDFLKSRGIGEKKRSLEKDKPNKF